MKIALVSYKKQEKFSQGVSNDEDADLIAFLQKKGVDVVSVIWNDNQVDWADFQVAVIKSPWDYHNHLSDFLSWLMSLEALKVTVLNPIEVIKWNSHKKYLKDLAQKGLRVIPSAYLQRGSSFENDYFEAFTTAELVAKPCISAGAQNTIRLNKANYNSSREQLDKLLEEGDYIVQPFIKEIKEGEWSFVFFNGVYSHCALKIPRQDDFRVQHYHGGTISYPKPHTEHIAQAGEYIKHVPGLTLYARVDGVIIDNKFWLMELELIEPYLFLNNDENLLENYYQVLLACL